MEIDGVLADAKHRHKFITGEHANWEAYWDPAEVQKDKVVPEALAVVSRLNRLQWTPVIISDRPEHLRATTMNWLVEKLDLNIQDPLVMLRSQGNLLTATESKKERLQQFVTSLERRNSALMFLDKDIETCEVYAAYGVPLLAPDCWGVLFPQKRSVETNG